MFYIYMAMFVLCAKMHMVILCFFIYMRVIINHDRKNPIPIHKALIINYKIQYFKWNNIVGLFDKSTKLKRECYDFLNLDMPSIY